MKKEDLKKYIPIVVIVILTILSIVIIEGYIVPIISAFILAHLMRPLYKQIRRTMPRPLAAFITTIIMLIIIVIPVIMIIGGVIAQLGQSITSDNLRVYLEAISKLPIFEQLNLNLDFLVSRVLNFLLGLFITATSQLPSIALSAVITLFGTYYLLTDWDQITKRMQKYIPIEDKEGLSTELARTTNSLVYGTLLIALLEFIIAAIGFSISGAPYALILAALIAIAAFIPGIGPGAVWIPLAAIMLTEGTPMQFVGIIITGLIISLGVDLFIRTKVTSSGSKIHPFIVLVGVLGGVTVFGLFGFIIGPLILTYTIKIVENIANS